MQLSVPWRYGQAKPFGSIPRINWAHPLAKGLISYCYDCGGGVVVDLVSQKVGTYTQIGAPTPAAVSTSKWGHGWKYLQQASTAAGVAVVFPTTVRNNNFGSSGTFSWACGFVQTALNTSGSTGFFWALDDSSVSHTYWGLGLNASSIPNMANDAGFYSFTTGRAVVNNNFTTIVMTASSPTAYVGYYMDSGGYFQTSTITVGANGTSTGQQASIGNKNPSTTGNSTSFYNGFIFYGAAWTGRQLTQAEAVQLNADPWCFLIYPEDEIFAMLVGAAVVAALPDAPAERIPWILPGLGPASRHVSLLNAGLPAQPVVQPVAGGTLPFMGVGG